MSPAFNDILAPSILSANLAYLAQEIEDLITAGAHWIHFDVMDNHYVPNLTFGPMLLKSLRDNNICAFIDVHIMAKPVDTLVDEFIVAGANAITIHPATANNPKATLNKIKSHNISAGLAINPTEPLDKFFALHAQINQLLIMTVEPGFSGQKFIDSTVAKIKQAAKFIYENNLPIRLCVDGGVDLNNIAMLKQAGCNTFIAGSSIFNKKEKNSNPYAHIISQFKLNLRG